jgi:hypothetical protein
MASNSATHLIILSHDPADVIVLAVPVISADPATETTLALVRRLLAHDIAPGRFFAAAVHKSDVSAIRPLR